jgi:hypothetical protein
VCHRLAIPVDGAPQSSVDDGSSAGDEFRGAASRGNNYALRLHQLQLMQAARHGGIARVAPVVDRKSIVDEKRDDSSAAFDVDYGWGGGRFGKRRNGDSLGLAGRFGRSVATGLRHGQRRREKLK